MPLGLKGTVVAISQMQPRADTVKLSDKLNTEPVYQILFDKSFLGGINSDGIDENRIFKYVSFYFFKFGCENMWETLIFKTQTVAESPMSVLPGFQWKLF